MGNCNKSTQNAVVVTGGNRMKVHTTVSPVRHEPTAQIIMAQRMAGSRRLPPFPPSLQNAAACTGVLGSRRKELFRTTLKLTRWGHGWEVGHGSRYRQETE